MEKLQAEREAAIALAAKLDTITQAQQTRTESSAWEEAVEKIYGNATPELREATELLKAAIKGATEQAKLDAMSEYQKMRQQEQEAVSKAETRIDSMLEELEDEYNIDLSDSQRKEYLKLMEKMSPKDREGNIVEYADHHAVWEIYQEKVSRNKPVNPAKDLAARSVTPSTGARTSGAVNEAEIRWLKENGII